MRVGVPKEIKDHEDRVGLGAQCGHRTRRGRAIEERIREGGGRRQADRVDSEEVLGLRSDIDDPVDERRNGRDARSLERPECVSTGRGSGADRSCQQLRQRRRAVQRGAPSCELSAKDRERGDDDSNRPVRSF